MSGAGRHDWAERLRRIAGPVLADTPLIGPATPAEARRFVDEFRDEHGHRRPVDRYLLSTVLGLPAEPPGAGAAADVQAWAGVAAGQDPPFIDLEAHGPLVFAPGRPGAPGIETSTEMELAVLHALWRRSGGPGGARARRRALAAARWAVAELQPDNATGHPWAVAVFLELWFVSDEPEARLYAETLVHNCLVAAGRPDRFSAVLLLDSANLLDVQAG